MNNGVKIYSTADLQRHLGARLRGRANGGLGGIHGGIPFEGLLVAIAERPQAVIETDDGGHHHYTIETLSDVEVQRHIWEPTP